MSSPNESPEVRRLYRSRTNRMLMGVCGGIGEYFNIDPTFVRLIFVLLVLANGIGILLYIIASIIVPLNPSIIPSKGPMIKIALPSNLINIIIIAVGLLILIFGILSLFWFSGNIPWSPWFIFSFVNQIFWPIALTVVGIMIVIIALGSDRRKQ